MVKHSNMGSSSEREDDGSHRMRRERNNKAVKKSRAKTKSQNEETIKRVKKLKDDNSNMVEKIKVLKNEIELMKKLFMEQAGNTELKLTQEQIQLLKEENVLETETKIFPK